MKKVSFEVTGVMEVDFAVRKVMGVSLEVKRMMDVSFEVMDVVSSNSPSSQASPPISLS